MKLLKWGEWIAIYDLYGREVFWIECYRIWLMNIYYVSRYPMMAESFSYNDDDLTGISSAEKKGYHCSEVKYMYNNI